MRNARLRAICFDMDGTLFNSFSVSYDAIREGFEAFWREIGENGPVPQWSSVRRLIGLPSHEFYPAVLPDSHHSHWKRLHRLVGSAERRRLGAGRGRTFDGVHDTLGELKERGYTLGCLSNASKRYFDAVLDSCDLRKYFSLFRHIGEDPTATKSQVLREWSDEFGGKEGIIYVGDRGGDVEAAREAGVRVVAVTWGYGSPEELARADAVINRMADLIGIVESMDRAV